MKHPSAPPLAGHKLGQLASTAICGNDITSSCLYVSALALMYAGRWGSLALLLVAGVLYFYRSIYAEVVGALPLNGGPYNALLNTTSKFRAAADAPTRSEGTFRLALERDCFADLVARRTLEAPFVEGRQSKQWLVVPACEFPAPPCGGLL